jgi:hypothetical protein
MFQAFGWLTGTLWEKSRSLRMWRSQSPRRGVRPSGRAPRRSFLESGVGVARPAGGVPSATLAKNATQMHRNETSGDFR